MRLFKTLLVSPLLITVAISASAAPPEGKGGGKGGGDDDPPADAFVPEFAYFVEGRKSKDLVLSNRAGDQTCTVISTASGNSKLRGFSYHAASKKLAYSIDGSGIFVSSWGDDPCEVGEGQSIRSQISPEMLDFSPDGGSLVWREPVQDFTGLGTAAQIFIHRFDTGATSEVSLETWGGSRPEWGVDGEWGLAGVRFSPDFASSNELIFVGGSLDGRFGEYDSLFAYDIGEANAPRKLLDGANISFDFVFSVTNPGGSGGSNVAFTDNNTGQIIQFPINAGEVRSFPGYEPAYSCDNLELVHSYGGGRKTEVRITMSDGSSTETLSRSNFRFFDWFCI